MACGQNLSAQLPSGEMRHHIMIVFSLVQQVTLQKLACKPMTSHGYWLFLFPYKSVCYPCAVIHWFDKIGYRPDEDTGMWKVRPSTLSNHSPNFVVIHTDTIYRAAHLIPVYRNRPISHDIRLHHSYNAFCMFYVNKYADHHAFEIAG